MAFRPLITRQRKANGNPPVNGKRVLRIMQANKLTLERHTGRRPGHTHDGVVIALRSKIRWCPITSSSPVVMARSCVCCLLSMPEIARLWAGWPPPPASPARCTRPDASLRRASIGSARRRIPSNVVRQQLSYIAKDTLDTATALRFKVVSRQSARHNPTASRRHSSKPSNAIMLGCHLAGC